MSEETNNPWRTKDGAWCTADDQLRVVKTMTEAQLRAAQAWPGNMKTVQSAIERRLRKIEKERPDQNIKAKLDALVGRIQYRPWNDREIKWTHEYQGTTADRWSAWYNGNEIGAVACGLSEHWEGHYAFMHSSRLGEFPSSAEEGKKWIETLFWAWIRRAAEDVPDDQHVPMAKLMESVQVEISTLNSLAPKGGDEAARLEARIEALEWVLGLMK